MHANIYKRKGHFFDKKDILKYKFNRFLNKNKNKNSIFTKYNHIKMYTLKKNKKNLKKSLTENYTKWYHIKACS